MDQHDISRFVYIYSRASGTNLVPVYVGRGTADRVTNHGLIDNNPELAEIIALGDYSVEVLDCGTSANAKLVEGALISAMLGRTRVDLKNRRQDTYQFLPLGVPPALAGRHLVPAVTPAELCAEVGGRVLFVRIGPKNLDAERGIIDLINPNPHAVIDRVRQWWALDLWVEKWLQDPANQPQVLVGVAGTEHRYVIGALDLRGIDWNTVELDGAYGSIPITSAGDEALDGLGLRGRSLKDAKIFGTGWAAARVWDQNGPVERPTR